MQRNGSRQKQRILRFGLLCVVLGAGLLMGLRAQEQKKQEDKKKDELLVTPRIELKNPLLPGRFHKILVRANVEWTDTGYDVFQGQVVQFTADRNSRISLQAGNPVAWCGPDGKDMNTVEQPIKGKNFGALIGRVTRLVSIEEDEESGEEIRNELVRNFYIGSGTSVTMPIDGRLYLGINELVFPDNTGFFRVTFYLR